MKVQVDLNMQYYMQMISISFASNAAYDVSVSLH